MRDLLIVVGLFGSLTACETLPGSGVGSGPAKDPPVVLYDPYLTEGWDALPAGKGAKVTGVGIAPMFASETGHWVVECPISWKIINDPESPRHLPGYEDEPLVQFYGNWVFAEDVENSYGDGCEPL